MSDESEDRHVFRPSGHWQWSLLDYVDEGYEPCLTCGLWKEHTVHAVGTDT